MPAEWEIRGSRGGGVQVGGVVGGPVADDYGLFPVFIFPVACGGGYRNHPRFFRHDQGILQRVVAEAVSPLGFRGESAIPRQSGAFGGVNPERTDDGPERFCVGRQRGGMRFRRPG